MSNELLVAAESLPVNPDEYDDRDIALAAEIVRAYLTEHSTEPVTVKWLESVLGPQIGEEDEFGWYLDHPRLFVQYDGIENYRVDDRTRGEVLSLLRWIQIPTKGTP